MPGETRYLILINMYVGSGYVETGRFFIGYDKKEASQLFAQLKGNIIIDDKVMLRLDFIAQSELGLDTVLNTLACTLNEMSENVKVIMKQTFRILNLV